MRKASWKAYFFVSALLPSVTFADDATDSALLPETITNVETLLAEPAYSPRWQLVQPVEPIPYSDAWLRPIDDVDFQDGSILGRLSRLRNLSFLTLAEISGARLYLGVNENGLAGVHFNVLPHYSGERILEVARMPYLKDEKLVDETEQTP